MKLAISNIAWSPDDDPAIFALLRELKVEGIEIAPTVVWPDWRGADPVAAAGYRTRLAAEGFRIPALQAILFGKPEIQLFRRETRRPLLDHFKLLAELAAALGATTLVFGSPKNRLRGELAVSDAYPRAAEVFWEIGEICSACGVFLGIEANPVEYGCDFITNIADARNLLEQTGHPHIRLHLDSGGMALTAGREIGDAVASSGEFIHYHASEPMLGDFGKPAVNHAAGGEALRRLNYSHWVSIEMRRSAPVSDKIREAVLHVRDAYFPAAVSSELPSENDRPDG